MRDSLPDPTLMGAALRASQSLDLERFVEICAEALGDMIGAESVHAYLRAPAGSDFDLHASWPPNGRVASRPPALLDRRVILEAGEEGHPASHSRLRPGGAPWPWGSPGRILLLPLGRAQEALGVFLVVAGPARRPFAPEETARCRAFMAAVEPALKNIELVRELKETALRDDIASCYNRRHFEAFLAEEIARAKRFHSRVSILFLDMDNLKEVNTAHGHSMGSRTLQEVSIRINAGIRKIDKLFRFGGDEFCVVLPETDSKGAREVGSRIRETIARSPLLVPEVGGVRLTASLGVATYPESGDTGETLVQAADRAMQRIKRSGKNGVGTAGPVARSSTAPEPLRPRRAPKGAE